jgi:hypothetical protein
MVYPRTFSTDLNSLRLIAIFDTDGEVRLKHDLGAACACKLDLSPIFAGGNRLTSSTVKARVLREEGGLFVSRFSLLMAEITTRLLRYSDSIVSCRIR